MMISASAFSIVMWNADSMQTADLKAALASTQCRSHAVKIVLHLQVVIMTITAINQPSAVR
jgi:hypothetical protein